VSIKGTFTVNLRPPTASYLALELQGSRVGFIASATGGEAFADVITESAQPSTFPKKHISAVRYRNIAIEFAQGMSKTFYSWLESITSTASAPPKDGAIVTYDTNFRELRRLEFTRARIVEVTFPELDAKATGPALMRITLAPQSTVERDGSGATALGPPRAAAWLAANFRVKLAALETLTTHVAPLILTDRAGTAHTVSDLVLSVPTNRAADLVAFHRDFVIAGHNDQAHERTATIELLTPDLRTVLVTVNLRGVGIYSLVRTKPATARDIEVFTAGLYCEELAVLVATPQPLTSKRRPAG
jgi:hypothetical protein